MTDNKPGPVRVEEPTGFDRTPTERIPVAGDLSDARNRQRTTGDTVDGHHELRDREQVAGTDAPEFRQEVNADGHDSLADRGADHVEHADEREMTTGRRDLPTGGSGSLDDRPDFSGESTDGERRVTESSATGEPSTEEQAATAESTSAGFFEENAVHRFRDRWRELQADFVDDPARAVRGADGLVDEVMRDLAERKRAIEGRWQGGTDDTERLRVAIKEYRAFFNQLLNV